MDDHTNSTDMTAPEQSSQAVLFTPPEMDEPDTTAPESSNSENLKEIILRNAEILVEELDLRPVLNFLVNKKKITEEQRKHILREERRRARVRTFLSIITAEFDSSLYYDLKASLQEDNSYILRRLEEDERTIIVREEDESLREDATKRVIRLMWRPLMDNLGNNEIVLAGHLSQKRRITPSEETHIVTSKRNSRDKAVELLQTVQRKGWPCLVELVEGLKTLKPLHDLTRRMVIAMEQYGRSDKCSQGSDVSEKSEMQAWQKVLLLTNYSVVREHLDPLTLADDMIELGIIEMTHRETLQRLNRHERTGWLLWHIVLEVKTEKCYNSFMQVLQQNEPIIFQVLKDKEDSLKNDPRTQSLKMMNFTKAFTDGELKCHCIKTSSGEIISTMSAETTDRVLSRITAFLEPYGDVIQAVEGSLTIHIRFYSLLKLTSFWLAYLDRSLANQMLDVFLTEKMLATHDPSNLHLDLEFDLNKYVDAAYQISMHPATPDKNNTISSHGLSKSEVGQPKIVDSDEHTDTGIVEEIKHEVKELKGNLEVDHYRKIIGETDEDIETLRKILTQKIYMIEKNYIRQVDDYKKIIEEKDREIETLLTVFKEEAVICDLVVRQAQRIEMENNNDLKGLVVYRGHVVVTHSKDDTLYVYRTGRSPIRKYQVTGLVDPYHMVGVIDTDNAYLVISDINHILHWVTILVEGTEVILGPCRTIKLDYMPYGMCVTSIGQVMVCGPDTDRLYKYSSDGQALAHMEKCGYIQVSSPLEPGYITPMSSGDGYVISDYRHLSWIRDDGTMSHRVLPEVSAGNHMHGPCELINDGGDHLLVADYRGHQVLVFDQHGHCTGQLLSDQDGIWGPSHLLLDQKTDTLYVACHKETRVMIYRYSPLLSALLKNNIIKRISQGKVEITMLIK